MKKYEDHLPGRVSIFGLDEEVRGVPVCVRRRGRLGVDIRGIRTKSRELRVLKILLYALSIGRWDLRVGIIDMGLG